MEDVVFELENNVIIAKKANTQQILASANDTNLTIITPEDLQKRFIADIIKDAIVKGGVTNIDTWMSYCYADGNVPSITKPSHVHFLHNFDERIFTNSQINPNEIVYKNVLKLSTLGYTQISDATEVFWESGYSAESLLRSENYHLVTTAASVMDSLSKPAGNIIFPPPDHKITFNPSFTHGLGFPDGVSWAAKTKSDGDGQPANAVFDVTIKYGTNAGTINAPNIMKNTVGREGNFKEYGQGNAVKNDKINALTRGAGGREIPLNAETRAEFIKHTMTKEFGDVAQVFMYLAYILLYQPIYKPDGDLQLIMREQKNATTMITTDSVVYMFCALLNLTCIYTGTQKGRVSGSCILRHYIAGDVNYVLKLNNMAKLHYNRIIENNSQIAFGLNLMMQDLGAFIYFRVEYGKMKRTFGHYNTNDPAKKDAIAELFRGKIELIQNANALAAAVYSAFNAKLDATPLEAVDYNETFVKTNYDALCLELDQQICSQDITKLKTKSYCLNPGDLLNRFSLIVQVQVPETLLPPADIDTTNMAGGAVYGYDEPSLKKAKELNGNNGTDENLVLGILFVDLFGIENVPAAPNLLKQQPDLETYLTIQYDLIVAKTLRNNVDIVFPSKTPLGTYIQHIDYDTTKQGPTENDYVELGNSLYQLSPFFPDKNDEQAPAVTDFITRTTRSNSLARGKLANTVSCDNTRDPLTNTAIPQGHGIRLNHMCFNVLNLKNWNEQNVRDPRGYINPYTRSLFSPKDQVLLHETIEYYKSHRVPGFFGGKTRKVKNRTHTLMKSQYSTKKNKTRRLTKASSKSTKRQRRRIGKRGSRNKK